MVSTGGAGGAPLGSGMVSARIAVSEAGRDRNFAPSLRGAFPQLTPTLTPRSCRSTHSHSQARYNDLTLVPVIVQQTIFWSA